MPWESLKSILDEARQDAEDARNEPITVCPICGELLNERNGIVDCPLGHYRTSQK